MFNWPGVGVNGGYSKITTTSTTKEVTTTIEQSLTKTLWDWLQLLIIPLVLALVAVVFNQTNTYTERQIAKQRYEQDQRISQDKQKEDLLQTYLDRVSELLLKENLRSSKPDEEVRKVARVRTINILLQLDSRRIEYLFAFLREAFLTYSADNPPIIDLSQAKLSNVVWEGINLTEINFSGANLSGADLKGASLKGTDLSNANLSNANLFGAFITDTNFSGADLRGIKLWHALQCHFNNANFSGIKFRKHPTPILSKNWFNNANFSGADLSGVKLDDCDLSNANFSGANLSGVNVRGTNLEGANLKGATGITIQELENQARTLKGAVMPDGSIHP